MVGPGTARIPHTSLVNGRLLEWFRPSTFGSPEILRQVAARAPLKVARLQEAFAIRSVVVMVFPELPALMALATKVVAVAVARTVGCAVVTPP